MIHYKDMTFCKFYNECREGKKCFRALTMDVEINAHSVGLPISMFVVKPECFRKFLPDNAKLEN